LRSVSDGKPGITQNRKVKSMENRTKKKVVSLLWGFSIGGVGKYAAIINDVSRYAPIDMETVCILSPAWHCDRDTIAKLSATEITIKSRYDISWIWKVAWELDRIKPDLIMTHGFNGHFVVMVTSILHRVQWSFICSYHGLYHAPSVSRKVYEKFFNIIMEHFIRYWALGVAVVAEHSQKYLVQKGVNASKITVIHNGIDNCMVLSDDARQRLRREWKIRDDEILLGIASRLDPVKGIEYLIDALSRLVQRNNKIKLAIVGTGSSENFLKQYVKESNLSDYIIFTGFRSDVNDCLSAFDIFILPSLAEYHSIALLEAMRAKKPIIATDVGGNTESVRDEIESLIIKPANVTVLCNAIERLVSDPTLCLRLASAAHERFQREFTTEQMIRKTAEWISQFHHKERIK
jgi:glycosyltransferase involved in cell wall biosynthesis